MMTTKEALQLVKRGQYAEADEIIVSALQKQLTEERVSLVCGADENGKLSIYTVPMGQQDTWYGKLLHHISDVFRRLGLKYADRISQYFYGPEERGCKSCYHRAEYIVHGILSGIAITAIFFVVIQILARWI